MGLLKHYQGPSHGLETLSWGLGSCLSETPRGDFGGAKPPERSDVTQRRCQGSAARPGSLTDPGWRGHTPTAPPQQVRDGGGGQSASVAGAHGAVALSEDERDGTRERQRPGPTGQAVPPAAWSRLT